MTRADEARRDPDGKQPPKIDYGTAWSYEFFLNAGPIDQFNAKYFNGRLLPLWHDFAEHADYDDYWQRRNALDILRDIKLPVLNVGGWFDEFDMYGTFATYRAIERHNPRNRSTLVVGPWRHGGWHEDAGDELGDLRFGSKTSAEYQRDVAFPFFEHHLRGKDAKAQWSAPEAVVYETGANRWHRLDRWPPATVPRNLYLAAGGRLAFEAPAGNAQYDEYISDPAKPIPYTTEISLEEGFKWMVADQRYAFTRPDVLSWRSDVLEADLTIAGPILANLFVSTSGTDSDWFVKVIDEQPHDAPESLAGRQTLLGFEVMRGKYRQSFSTPKAMVAGEVTPVSFNVWDKFHTFKKGHRIMVQIQSSWFPFFDRNPQVFTNIYRAKPDQFRAATQRVYRSGATPSHLVLPVFATRP
jgi:putative CocE/NonD family hydrolase